MGAEGHVGHVARRAGKKQSGCELSFFPLRGQVYFPSLGTGPVTDLASRMQWEWSLGLLSSGLKGTSFCTFVMLLLETQSLCWEQLEPHDRG